ncbi:hypothetical protein [Nocardia amamiensis]|uniref:hypothetical protein n=1 Tax=Nocardia amamiensis TaxID=404578 RepID=UPI000AAA7BB2|nr:hypothetical protein [Nocardia amamiensis]
MVDPITVAILGAAFTESIRFLYEQASELLRRRNGIGADEASTTPIQVPVPEAAPLDARPRALTADPDILESRHKRIAKLAAEIAQVAQEWISTEDVEAQTEQSAGELRAVLEEVYGQRLTFAGENREPTGTKVSQVIDTFTAGDVTGMETRTGTVGDATIQQKVRQMDGGNLTGVRIDRE